MNNHFTTIAEQVLPSSATHLSPALNNNSNVPSSREFSSFQCVSNEQVLKALSTLDAGKAAGADDIPVKAIKSMAGYIAPSIAYLINESFRQGEFPLKWKIARVSPLFKGGISTNCNNYRPVSVLPCLAKVLERFANQQLQDFAVENKLISEKQFAYQKRSSCNIALIRLVDEWKWSIDIKQIAVAAFLDLRKAFDVINHNLLLKKLESAGVSGSAFYWFKSYLDNRRQYVTCNSTESKSLALRHGVPQGSVLGPTLFCAHYNDVISAVKHSSCTLFADDTEIHYSDGDINKASNCVNRDLDNISSWLSSNQMVVHPGKSEVMKIGTQRSLKNCNDLNIFIHDHRLKEVTSYKYLGVYVDSTLAWKEHLSYIQKRMYPKIRVLNKLSCFLTRSVLLKIYKQTMLPIFDYGCFVWMECSNSMIDSLERLQNQVMRTILKADRTSCTQSMRSELGLLTLKNRRRFLRFQLVYKIINDYNCPNQLKGYLPRRSSLHGRDLRDNTTLHLPKANTTVGQKTFQYAAAKDWNDLPKSIRSITTLSSFKAALYSFLLKSGKLSHRCRVN